MTCVEETPDLEEAQPSCFSDGMAPHPAGGPSDGPLLSAMKPILWPPTAGGLAGQLLLVVVQGVMQPDRKTGPEQAGRVAVRSPAPAQDPAPEPDGPGPGDPLGWRPERPIAPGAAAVEKTP